MAWVFANLAAWRNIHVKVWVWPCIKTTPRFAIRRHMSVLETKLNARTADFQTNGAAMRTLVDDLAEKVAK